MQWWGTPSGWVRAAFVTIAAGTMIVVGAGTADAQGVSPSVETAVVASGHIESAPGSTATAAPGTHARTHTSKTKTKSGTKTAAKKSKSKAKKTKHHRAKKPVVTVTTESETSPIPFQSTTVSTNTLAKGVSRVTTAGVNGVMTTTYQITTTDGVQTAKTQVSQAVTTPPVTQVTSVGTYVAPAPKAPAPAPAPAPPAPAPAPAPAPQGPLITPGAFCADAALGSIGHSAAGTSYKCGGHGADANGHYHWNTMP